MNLFLPSHPGSLLLLATTESAGLSLDPLKGFLWGVLGGVLAEIAAQYKLRQTVKEKRPAYLKDPFYWLLTILMVLGGGGLVVMYILSGMGEIRPLIAVNIGATAPLIIQTLSAAAPRPRSKVN